MTGGSDPSLSRRLALGPVVQQTTYRDPARAATVLEVRVYVPDHVLEDNGSLVGDLRAATDRRDVSRTLGWTPPLGSDYLRWVAGLLDRIMGASGRRDADPAPRRALDLRV